MVGLNGRPFFVVCDRTATWLLCPDDRVVRELEVLPFAASPETQTNARTINAVKRMVLVSPT